MLSSLSVSSCIIISFYPSRPPVVFCLSVVCNVRAPYLAGWNFRQCFYAILYLGGLAIRWPPGKILRISSQWNFSVEGVKRKRNSRILRFWTYRRLYLGNGAR